jgi:hypothetical protein
MRKHWIVGASTLIGIGAVVATGAARPVFGTQSSARSFARVAGQMRLPAASRPA